MPVEAQTFFRKIIHPDSKTNQIELMQLFYSDILEYSGEIACPGKFTKRIDFRGNCATRNISRI
jgi:hypothetical protein